MHHGSRRKLTDVLTCIRRGIGVEHPGTAAQANAEQRLRCVAEMQRIFAGHESALEDTLTVADRLQFDIIRSLRHEYPSEITGGETAADRLKRLAQDGLTWRYPQGVPDAAKTQMAHELTLIGKLGYEPYFLTVHDIVAFARSRNILCQGRGSAANSITCCSLGVTSVSHYRGKRAVREVGRAMGLSEDILSALSSQIWGSWSRTGPEAERMREIGLDPSSPRRALATFKKHGNVSEMRTRFLRGMRDNGYDDDFAERCFSQIEGFGSYGFPESHAASFALLVYASSWLKCHHRGIFACALLTTLAEADAFAALGLNRREPSGPPAR